MAIKGDAEKVEDLTFGGVHAWMDGNDARESGVGLGDLDTKPDTLAFGVAQQVGHHLESFRNNARR
jgi:hypothetical protein